MAWLIQSFVFLLVACLGCHGPVEIESNIIYRKVEQQELKLDLYLPKSLPKKRRPAIIALHGGAWRQGNKEDMSEIAIKLANRGYVVAAVQYRFAPESVFPSQLEDVQAAVRWIREHADQYQLDEKKIGGIGASAGAHLVSLLGLVDDPSYPISSQITCVVSLAGPVDLRLSTCRNELAESPALEQVEQWLVDFIGQPYNSQNDQLWRSASPLFQVSKTSPPFFLIHGTADQVVSIKQAEALVESLSDQSVPVAYRYIPKLNHSLDVNYWVLLRFWQALKASFRFLDRHLKQ